MEAVYEEAVRAPRELNEKEWAFVLCIAAVGIAGIGFAFPLPSTLLSLAFAGFLIVWASPIALPALAILWIQAVSFRAYQPATEFDNALMIGGVPLTLQLFTLIAMTARGVVAWTSPSQSLVRDRWTQRSFGIWALFFLITILAAIWGRRLGYPNWTQPLRASMSLGCVFYGLALTPQFRRAPWVAEWMLRIAIGVLVLVGTGLYWNHVVFFYLPLVCCALWYALRHKRWGLVTWSALAPWVGLFAEDALTFMGLVVLALVLGYGWFSAPRAQAARKTSKWTRRAMTVAFGMSLLLLAAVLFTDYSPEYTPGTTPSLSQRFLFKLYLDRGVLWRATWSNIVENPELLSPAGRPLVIISPFFSLENNLWTVHVHNSFLEIFRATGIVGGLVFLVLVIRFWRRLRRVMLDISVPVVRVFAGAVLVAVLVGSATGLWPFDFHAGPWIWLWVGLALGLSQHGSQSNSKTPNIASQ